MQEILLTLQLERKYSKEEILEKYLNTIYFGHAAYGIEAAARTYFNKPAKELSLAEAACWPASQRACLLLPYINEDTRKRPLDARSRCLPDGRRRIHYREEKLPPCSRNLFFQAGRPCAPNNILPLISLII